MNQRHLALIAVFAIIALGFTAYCNSFGGQLMLDDINLVKDNVYIKSPSFIKTIFTTDINAGSGRVSKYYRPLQTFAYMVGYRIWKLDPAGYHVINTVIHILAALSAFWLLWLIFGNMLTAFFAAALWVVHPVHTEAVSYISGIADPLVALFLFLTLAFYIKDDQKNDLRSYAGSLTCFVMAFLSRETAVLVFPLLALYHFTFRRRVSIIRVLPFFAVTAGYFLFRKAIDVWVVLASNPTTVWQRLPGFFTAITNYTRLLFLPFDLRMEYGLELFRFTDIKAIIGVVILVAFMAALYVFRKNRLVFFSLAWIGLCIMPSSNLYPINAFMAEHWLYIPSIGFFLLVSAAFTGLIGKNKFKTQAMIAMAALVIFYTVLTIMQNSYWKDNFTFYTRTLKYAPNSFLLHNNLGNVLNDMGKKEEAVESYKRSLAINPLYGSAYISLGSVYDDLGLRDEAIKMFKKAVEIDPKDYVLAYVNLGIVYASMGKLDEAEEAYMNAIKTAPSLAYAYSGLGMVYLAKGDAEKAIELCKKAVELNPDLPNSYNDLGTIYGAVGKLQESMAAYKRALKINPNYGAAHYNLAVAYFKNGQYDLAIKEYDISLKLGVIPRPVFTDLIEKYRSGEKQ